MRNEVEAFAKAVRDNPPMIGRGETIREEFERRRLSVEDFVERFRPIGVTKPDFRAAVLKAIR